jgi:hypothetical protein
MIGPPDLDRPEDRAVPIPVPQQPPVPMAQANAPMPGWDPTVTPIFGARAAVPPLPPGAPAPVMPTLPARPLRASGAPAPVMKVAADAGVPALMDALDALWAEHSAGMMPVAQPPLPQPVIPPATMATQAPTTLVAPSSPQAAAGHTPRFTNPMPGAPNPLGAGTLAYGGMRAPGMGDAMKYAAVPAATMAAPHGPRLDTLPTTGTAPAIEILGGVGPRPAPRSTTAPVPQSTLIGRLSSPSRPPFPEGRAEVAQATVGELAHANLGGFYPLSEHLHEGGPRSVRGRLLATSLAGGYPATGPGQAVPASTAQLLSETMPYRLPPVAYDNNGGGGAGFDRITGKIWLPPSDQAAPQGSLDEPAGALRHEAEHGLQALSRQTWQAREAAGIPTVSPLTREQANHWQFAKSTASELGPSLGDIPFTAEAYRREVGRPLHARVPLAPGVTPDAAWMARQAEQHGFFNGRSMTELLATPSGQAYLKRLMDNHMLPTTKGASDNILDVTNTHRESPPRPAGPPMHRMYGGKRVRLVYGPVTHTDGKFTSPGRIGPVKTAGVSPFGNFATTALPGFGLMLAGNLGGGLLAQHYGVHPLWGQSAGTALGAMAAAPIQLHLLRNAWRKQHAQLRDKAAPDKQDRRNLAALDDLETGGDLGKSAAGLVSALDAAGGAIGDAVNRAGYGVRGLAYGAGGAIGGATASLPMLATEPGYQLGLTDRGTRDAVRGGSRSPAAASRRCPAPVGSAAGWLVFRVPAASWPTPGGSGATPTS